MSLEREAIRRHFSRHGAGEGVSVGVGDDAAVLRLGERTAVSTDTLACGTHFTEGADPRLLGRKSLSVALSDLAAMGARPRHALLSLTLPGIDDAWLGNFADGFYSVADEHSVSLVGGDLCRGGERQITVTVIGESEGEPLLLSGAKEGDEIWLTGSVGAAGDELRSGAPAASGSALHDPVPRVGLGIALSGVASAATDLSDGLCVGALALARESGVRLEIDGASVPVGAKAETGVPKERLVEAACSGEDYELLFAAPASARERVEDCGKQAGVELSAIGTAAAGSGAALVCGGEEVDLKELSESVFEHFSEGGSAGAGGREGLVREVAALALGRGARVFVAESCTGGLLAGALTSVAGSSDWFAGGAVTYSVDMKVKSLGVSRETVDAHGVVSEQVAGEMAAGALRAGGATHAVAVTGWAGPEGGDGQPAGTVCVAWAGDGGTATAAFRFGGGRAEVRDRSVGAALEGLRDMLKSG